MKMILFQGNFIFYISLHFSGGTKISDLADHNSISRRSRNQYEGRITYSHVKIYIKRYNDHANVSYVIIQHKWMRLMSQYQSKSETRREGFGDSSVGVLSMA